MEPLPAHASSSSVDPREVEYYHKLAQLWWDQNGPFWPLHRLNRLRLGYIKTKLSEHFELDERNEQPLLGLKVLDIGCGGGILAESMARLGASVTGIDVVEKNIAIASQHAASTGVNVSYQLSTVETLARSGSQFDVVLNMEVVEHVTSLVGFMESSCSLLKPGGMMFIATINRTLIAWLVAIVGAEYILRWMPKGTHRLSMFRKPAEIRDLLAQNRLMVKDLVGVGVNPLAKQMFLTRLRSVNYMLTAVHALERPLKLVKNQASV
jgi:2-polyprenyl-6-hydroxyphenyl methylase/3-demethylubiquinone-9 3-methyltransferase